MATPAAFATPLVTPENSWSPRRVDSKEVTELKADHAMISISLSSKFEIQASTNREATTSQQCRIQLSTRHFHTKVFAKHVLVSQESKKPSGRADGFRMSCWLTGAASNWAMLCILKYLEASAVQGVVTGS